MIRLSAVGIACLICAAPATAHLPYTPKCKSLECIERSQQRNLAHAEYVAHHGAHAHRRWAKRAVVWLTRELGQTWARLHPPAPRVVSWVERQMYAAAVIARESGSDPWPSCPDPWDGGSFSSLVACENGGSWYDSPGYYRCGLQFDPIWERRFGRLCP
ncbi:MAG: hypothetical protein ACJ780_28670 [Solirubrobacteraceae bacterium]